MDLTNIAENKENNNAERNLANLEAIKVDVDKFETKTNAALAKRVTCLLCTFISTWLFISLALIPLISFMYLSSKPASVLNEKLGLSKGMHTINLFKDSDSIEKILTTDALFTSWDIQNRSPR